MQYRVNLDEKKTLMSLKGSNFHSISNKLFATSDLSIAFQWDQMVNTFIKELIENRKWF